MHCPNCNAPLTPKGAIDGRTTPWRVRVRLYLATELDTPQADSDPAAPADAAGETVLPSQLAIAQDLATMAANFHTPLDVLGLDQWTLEAKLRTLRSTISRRRTGDAVWRVPYQTSDGREWLARVDVQREEKPNARP